MGAQAAAADTAARARVDQKGNPANEPQSASTDPTFRLEVLKLAYTSDRTPDQVIEAANKYLEWTNG